MTNTHHETNFSVVVVCGHGESPELTAWLRPEASVSKKPPEWQKNGEKWPPEVKKWPFCVRKSLFWWKTPLLKIDKKLRSFCLKSDLLGDEKWQKMTSEVEKVTFRSLYTISGGPFLGPAKTPEDFLRVSLKRSTFQTLFSSKNDLRGWKSDF